MSQLAAAIDDEMLDDDADDLLLKFPADVQAAIEQVLPSTDPLDQADFNSIDYINALFPTEQSLAGIDDVVAQMQDRIAHIDDDISTVVRGQTAAAHDGRQALDEAQRVIKLLFVHIKDIKERAEKSEEMVREITRDIKQLDCAKRNLTLAITALSHLHTLVGTVDTLKTLTSQKQYSEIASPLQAISGVMTYFAEYTDIPQIKTLSEQVREIECMLAEQITADFKAAFANDSKIVVPNKQLTQACFVVSILEPRVKRDLLKWFIDVQLAEYNHLFEGTEDAAWLDKIDKRYAWIKRHLLEFEERLGAMFPQNWEVSERLTVQFCNRTREDLAVLMEKRRQEIDVKLLLHAIQKTSSFENLLARRFTGITITGIDPSVNSDSLDIEATLRQSPFHGLIGRCFKPHLGIYVESVRKNLVELIDRFAQEERITIAGCAVDSAVLPSCSQLFVCYKKNLVQCSQLDNGNSLLDLSRVFQHFLREYATKLLQQNLPRNDTNSTSTSTAAQSAAAAIGTSVQSLTRDFQKMSTAGIIQNISTLLKEGESGFGSVQLGRGFSQEELARVCCILTTAEYCYETTNQLAEKLREKITREHADKIDFSQEQKHFTNVISNCVDILVQDFLATCEPHLTAMSKIQWQNINSVGDQSAHISAIRTHLQQHVPTLRNALGGSRKYFTQFCVRFAGDLVHRYIHTVYKCRPMSNTEGAEQLLLDTHTLKTVLLSMPTLGGSSSSFRGSTDAGGVAAAVQTPRGPPPTYTKVVHKEISRAEMILKVVMTPIEPARDFVEHYIRLLPDLGVVEFTRVLEMKSVRKQEQSGLIELFRAAKRPVGSDDGDHVDIASHNDNVVAGIAPAPTRTGSSIRKLERMIKKKLPS